MVPSWAKTTWSQQYATIISNKLLFYSTLILDSFPDFFLVEKKQNLQTFLYSKWCKPLIRVFKIILSFPMTPLLTFCSLINSPSRGFLRRYLLLMWLNRYYFFSPLEPLTGINIAIYLNCFMTCLWTFTFFLLRNNTNLL